MTTNVNIKKNVNLFDKNIYKNVLYVPNDQLEMTPICPNGGTTAKKKSGRKLKSRQLFGKLVCVRHKVKMGLKYLPIEECFCKNCNIRDILCW